MLPIASMKMSNAAILEPHFQYYCSVWGYCGANTISQLEKHPNRAARILMERGFNASSVPLIESLGWKTLRELIDGESKIMVYKYINGFAPQYLHNLFIRNSTCSSYALRNTTTDLKIPKKSSTNGQKSFSYRDVKLWKSLPNKAKQSPPTCVFKTSYNGLGIILVVGQKLPML